jgi:integrase/recombinase XerC
VALEVDGVRAEDYRDMRGPGRQGFRKLLAQLQARADAKGARARAIVRLLFGLALRWAEVVRLDVADVDLPGRGLQVLGKGRPRRCG